MAGTSSYEANCFLMRMYSLLPGSACCLNTAELSQLTGYTDSGFLVVSTLTPNCPCECGSSVAALILAVTLFLLLELNQVMKRQEADLEAALKRWSGWTGSGVSPSEGQGRLDVEEIKHREARLRCPEQ